MKKLSPFLIAFASIAAVFTLIFRYNLSFALDSQSQEKIILSALIYGISMFIAGSYFGQIDRKSQTGRDFGLRFHLSTYLVYNILSVLWFNLGLNSRFETVDSVYSTIIIWGLFLSIHFIMVLLFKNKSIA